LLGFGGSVTINSGCRTEVKLTRVDGGNGFVVDVDVKLVERKRERKTRNLRDERI
jgi:hypothetical protein